MSDETPNQDAPKPATREASNISFSSASLCFFTDVIEDRVGRLSSSQGLRELPEKRNSFDGKDQSRNEGRPKGDATTTAGSGVSREEMEVSTVDGQGSISGLLAPQRDSIDNIISVPPLSSSITSRHESSIDPRSDSVMCSEKSSSPGDMATSETLPVESSLSPRRSPLSLPEGKLSPPVSVSSTPSTPQPLRRSFFRREGFGDRNEIEMKAVCPSSTATVRASTLPTSPWRAQGTQTNANMAHSTSSSPPVSPWSTRAIEANSPPMDRRGGIVQPGAMRMSMSRLRSNNEDNDDDDDISIMTTGSDSLVYSMGGPGGTDTDRIMINQVNLGLQKQESAFPAVLRAELAVDSQALIRERDDLRRQLAEERCLQRSSMNLQTAESLMVMATPATPENEEEASDDREEPAEEKRTYKKYLFELLLFVLVISVVLLADLLGRNRQRNQASVLFPSQAPTSSGRAFFDRLGSLIDTEEPYNRFASSLSLNQDGTVLAVADNSGVYLYEWNDVNNEWVKQGKDPGSATIPLVCGSPPDPLDEDSLTIRSNIVVDISRSGKSVAVGCPWATFQVNATSTVEFTGKVELYHRVDQGWQLSGNAIYGSQSKSYFGAAVSISGDGSRVAVGSPGQADLGLSVYSMNQNGEWHQVGNSMPPSVMTLRVGSVSISAEGSIVAAGGTPRSGGNVVVRMYSLNNEDRAEWSDMGIGISGKAGVEADSPATLYRCELSGNGKAVAISNSYLDKSAFLVADEESTDALAVSVWKWSEAIDEWVMKGTSLHTHAVGPKSGYFVSLSDDARLLGLGDPGSGRTDVYHALTGHVHVYHFNEEDEDWTQLGHNEYEETAGDQLGFAMSMSGDGSRMAVGAPFSRAKGFEHGRAYVYDLEPFL